MTANNAYLMSKIRLDARLKTNMASVKSTLSSHPYLRRSSEGGILRYVMQDDQRPGRFNTLALERSCITFTTFSESSPTYVMGESLSRLISIALMLSEDYDIDYRCMLPYLVHLLSGTGLQIREREHATFDRDCDLILSRRIIFLSARVSELESRLSAQSDAAASLAARIISSGKMASFSVAELSKQLGVGPDILERAIDVLSGMGYRISRSSGGKIELMIA